MVVFISRKNTVLYCSSFLYIAHASSFTFKADFRSPQPLFSSSYLDSLNSGEFEPTTTQTQTPTTKPSVTKSPNRTELKNKFLTGIASTDRGQLAIPSQREVASSLLNDLAAQNPIQDTTTSQLSRGTWELIYSDTQLFRSSPFFMAGRAVCQDGDEAERYDWFCDMHRAALAISTIGKVRQIVSSDKLVSEFEVKVGAIPFLSDYTPFSYSGGMPVQIEGAIVSSATIESNTMLSPQAYSLFMDTVEIRGSNIPLLRSLLDSPKVKLQSRKLGDFLENKFPDQYTNPKPVFETIYLDEEGFRVSKDQDGKLFVYTKVSDSEEETVYENVMPDLGITKLLEGFNDKILKFYI